MCGNIKSTIFALGDVAALITSLWVGGVAPRTDPIPIRIPAVVQLQTVGGCRSPPETNREVQRVSLCNYAVQSKGFMTVTTDRRYT